MDNDAIIKTLLEQIGLKKPPNPIVFDFKEFCLAIDESENDAYVLLTNLVDYRIIYDLLDGIYSSFDKEDLSQFNY